MLPTTPHRAEEAIAAAHTVKAKAGRLFFSVAQQKKGLGVLLSAELGSGVGDADVQLSRALHDLLALARGDIVRDLCGVLPARNEKKKK